MTAISQFLVEMELAHVLITPDLNKCIVEPLPGGPPVWLMKEEEPVLSTSLSSHASLRECISSYSRSINLPRVSRTHLWQNLPVVSMLRRDVSALSTKKKKKIFSFFFFFPHNFWSIDVRAQGTHCSQMSAVNCNVGPRGASLEMKGGRCSLIGSIPNLGEKLGFSKFRVTSLKISVLRASLRNCFDKLYYSKCCVNLSATAKWLKTSQKFLKNTSQCFGAKKTQLRVSMNCLLPFGNWRFQTFHAPEKETTATFAPFICMTEWFYQRKYLFFYKSELGENK